MLEAPTGRPSRVVIAAEVVALAGAVAFAIVRGPQSNWDLGLLVLLAAIAAAADLMAVVTPVRRISVSASFLTIVVAIVLLGASAAAIVSVVAILVGWLRERYAGRTLLINVVDYAWFPLLAGLAFDSLMDSTGLGHGDPAYYLLVFATFAIALVLNFTILAAYMSYARRISFSSQLRRALLPLLPSELASALLTVGVVWSFFQVGVAAVALAGLVILVFQYLVGALITSQARADELEVRAKQLATFQVALLGALVRTLDLRDRMTARHSAAVARYAREIAAVTGLSADDQELAHAAGLLHDIGKFVLPDRILKSRGRLTEDDWVEIRKHPEEGAKIVSQVDGYEPISEIILAHHERVDGLGYPRGLTGEQIPTIAKIIAVADSYDAMTARDTYRSPISSAEAIAEMRRVSGAQLDGSVVEAFAGLLESKDFVYRHGADADFESELARDQRIQRPLRRGASEQRKAAAAQVDGR